MIDPLTIQLFGQFPREFAVPGRSMMYDISRFDQLLVINDGVSDCYTSVFSFGEKGIVIDKIFLDFDRKRGLCDGATALNDAKRVYRYMGEQGHVVIPVASGKKGVHLYILLAPIDYEKQEGKTTLYRATIHMLEEVFGPLEQAMEHTEDEKSINVYYALDEDRRVLGVDPKIVGDIRRISRIPNTRRPPANNSWCTWLPPEFVDFTWLDVIDWCKMPHEFDRTSLPTKTLDDLPKIDVARRVVNSNIQTNTLPEPRSSNIFLKSHLRPCLYRAITQQHPEHHTRVAATVDLLKFWSPRDICNMYESLHWTRWDRMETLKQISSCGYLRPYSCTKQLIPLGLCLVDDPADCPLKNNDIPLEAMIEE